MEWTHSLPEGLERAKGFFRFAQEPELQEFQFFPPRTSTVAPVMLLDEPDHVVVLIGRDYDQERCRKPPSSPVSPPITLSGHRSG